MNSIIYLGGGCFWCIESVFKKVKGVLSITPGYMGGDIPNPTYEEVCEGYTNHVEVVKVEYDNKINISQILSIFFVVHDPTSINRQGADVGTQYRSAIFCNSKERPLIVDFIQELESENIFDDMMKGINLIGLQTLFPKLLLLIVIFLSLLISTFICLSEINSPANVRVSTIRCVSFHEFFATYTSSLIIIFPPILIVLVLGYTIFELSIPFLWVFIAMYLLSTTFIMLGMSLSYLVVKESITMLITTFLLMFLLFFSGYILPIERMSTVSKIIAEISPGKISLDLFNQLTFYHQSIQTVMIGFLMLFVWYISSMLITYIIKILRNL